jgi:hypothetical protein
MPTRLTEEEKAEAFEDVLWMLQGGEHPSRILPRINNKLTFGQIHIRLKDMGKDSLAAKVFAEMELAKKKGKEDNV